MEVSRGFKEEEIEHIALLARIELRDEERELFARQFKTIINYFHIIDEVDTTGVEPTLHVLKLTNALREDIVAKSLLTETALANAPNREKKYFKAPRII